MEYLLIGKFVNGGYERFNIKVENIGKFTHEFFGDECV